MKAIYQGLSYQGGTRPARLKIRFSVINDSGHEGIFFGFKGQFRIINARNEAENYNTYIGELFDITNLAYTINANTQAPIELYFILDPYTKEVIEEQRLGNLRFNFNVSSFRIQTDNPKINMVNEGTQVTNDTGNNIIKIPRSEWTDILQESGYNKFQIVEIPIDYSEIINRAKNLGNDGIEDRFKKAAQHLETIMKKMDEGNWSESVGECRLVIDTLTKEQIKNEDGEFISIQEAIGQILKKNGFPDKNITSFKMLLVQLSSYCSLKHHVNLDGNEQDIIVPMKREDALFVVSNTVTILNLLTRKYISTI